MDWFDILTEANPVTAPAAVGGKITEAAWGAVFGHDSADKPATGSDLRAKLAAQAAKAAPPAATTDGGAAQPYQYSGSYLVTKQHGDIHGRAVSNPYIDPQTGQGWDEASSMRQWQALMKDPKQAAKWKLDLYMAGYYGTSVNAGQLVGSRFDDADVQALLSAVKDAVPMGEKWQDAAKYKIQAGYQNGGPVTLSDLSSGGSSAKDAAHQQALADRAEMQDLAAFRTDLRDFAQRNGIKTDDSMINQELKRYSAGDTSAEMVKSDWRERYLTSAFPAWADDIRAGKNLDEIASPYTQTMAQVLELNPNTVDMFNPKIRKALQSVGGDGKASQKPLWQFENELKDDPRWQYTDNAHETMSSYATGLRSLFGI